MKMPHSRSRNALATDPARPVAGMSQNALAPSLGVSSSMYRPDGSMKGQGFLGPLKNARGETMTEYSIGVGIDGRDMDIPTLVPTLSPEEIQHILNMQDGGQIPPAIQQKAVEHALMRMRQGLSPFHDDGLAHARGRR
jgi:hypothetical protein